MSLDRRTQLSLGWRMLVALAVLTGLSLVVGATAVLVGGVLAWMAVLAFLLLFGLTGIPTVFPREWDLLAGLAGDPFLVVPVFGVLLLPVLYVQPVRDELREFQRELGATGTLAEERHPEVATMARRLAQQADVAEPDLYIANRRRPESYALGGRSGGTIVVTRGVVRQLTDEELRAVIAHEISHLANGDSRIMNLSIVPMLVAEHVGSDRPPRLQRRGLFFPFVYVVHLAAWAGLSILTWLQYLSCRLGVSFLSRGREFAADRGAARLTGSPGALASALQQLDDERGTPGEDKRTWAQSASALDILPSDDVSGPLGLFRTHPSTEKRIQQLQRLASEA